MEPTSTPGPVSIFAADGSGVRVRDCMLLVPVRRECVLLGEGVPPLDDDSLPFGAAEGFTDEPSVREWASTWDMTWAAKYFSTTLFDVLCFCGLPGLA